MEYNSVYDAVCTALARHGVRAPRNGSWIRIPAVWRGSNDPNVSVNSESGVVKDWPDNISFSFAVLMDSNHLGSPDIRLSKGVSMAKADRVTVQKSHLERIEDAKKKWDIGESLNSDYGHSAICRHYLKTRGLTKELIDFIGPSVKTIGCNGGGAIMVTPLISSVNGMRVGIQRLYLDSNANKMVFDDNSGTRKMMGITLHDGFAAGYLLDRSRSSLNKNVLICEGFETGCALSAATGLAVYITYSAGGMERVNIDHLSKLGFTEVIICGDNDTRDNKGVMRGHKAAYTLAAKFFDVFQRSVKIAIPTRTAADGKSVDWMDVWKKDPVGTKNAIQKSMVVYDAATDVYRMMASDVPELRGRPLSAIKRGM